MAIERPKRAREEDLTRAPQSCLNWSRTTWAKRSWRSSRRCRSKCLWCSRPVRAIR